MDLDNNVRQKLLRTPYNSWNNWKDRTIEKEFIIFHERVPLQLLSIISPLLFRLLSWPCVYLSMVFMKAFWKALHLIRIHKSRENYLLKNKCIIFLRLYRKISVYIYFAQLNHNDKIQNILTGKRSSYIISYLTKFSHIA